MTQNKLTEMINALTNQELSEIFDNIKELQETACLGSDNPYRNLLKKIEDELGISYSMHALERDVLFLIAKRTQNLLLLDKGTFYVLNKKMQAQKPVSTQVDVSFNDAHAMAFDKDAVMSVIAGVKDEQDNNANVQELREALSWVVDQFEKVLGGQKAGNVVESLSYAKSVMKQTTSTKKAKDEEIPNIADHESLPELLRFLDSENVKYYFDEDYQDTLFFRSYGTRYSIKYLEDGALAFICEPYEDVKSLIEAIDKKCRGGDGRMD